MRPARFRGHHDPPRAGRPGHRHNRLGIAPRLPFGDPEARPDFEKYRPLFENSARIKHYYDHCPGDGVYGAFDDWLRSLDLIDRLGLTAGGSATPVEGFYVESAGDRLRVGFEVALWWLAMHEAVDR